MLAYVFGGALYALHRLATVGPVIGGVLLVRPCLAHGGTVLGGKLLVGCALLMVARCLAECFLPVCAVLSFAFHLIFFSSVISCFDNNWSNFYALLRVLVTLVNSPFAIITPFTPL